jgi:hypothetical protein
MTDDACSSARRIEHGDRCDCALLAQATHLDPRALSFDYCQRVLHLHWRMTCRHGRPPAPSAAGPGERWRDIGPVDPVKAILISN